MCGGSMRSQLYRKVKKVKSKTKHCGCWDSSPGLHGHNVEFSPLNYSHFGCLNLYLLDFVRLQPATLLFHNAHHNSQPLLAGGKNHIDSWKQGNKRNREKKRSSPGCALKGLVPCLVLIFFCKIKTVALSFVFDKNCSIID